MIEFREVSKKLGRFILKGSSFTLPNGYICGLAGLNGAGKTTLLHLLLGLYQPDEGSILVDGMSYEDHEKQIHDRMGVVLTEELFESSLSCKQNSAYYGKYFSGYSRERMAQYLALFGLDQNEKFGKLSKGQKLKCQFAFALAHDAKLLILDEPTANFDPHFREQFFRLLQEFTADGKKSVILATHLTEDLDRIADYLIYLEQGSQIYAGDMESFRESYRIVAGEAYQIKLLPKEKILCLEEKPYGARALVSHSRLNRYDPALSVTYPTIEEFMYFYSKRSRK